MTRGKKLTASLTQVSDDDGNDGSDQNSLLLKILLEFSKFHKQYTDILDKCHSLEIENLTLKNDFKSLKDDIDDLRADNIRLFQKLEEIKAGTVGGPHVSVEAHKGLPNAVSTDMTSMVSDVTREINARASKAKNIVILNLPEASTPTSEMEGVEELFSGALHFTEAKSQVTEMFRLGQKRDGKPRPLKVKLASEAAKSRIIENARKWMKDIPSDHKLKRVFIRSDMTELERANAQRKYKEQHHSKAHRRDNVE